VYHARTNQTRPQKMSLLSSVLSLGKLRAVAKAISIASAKIAKSDILRAVVKMILLELDNPGLGKGSEKLDELIKYAGEALGLDAEKIELIERIVTTLVDLFNAVGLFRKLKAS
jgi:response regulator RpfG family c-di-GMP phosphodiesterase